MATQMNGWSGMLGGVGRAFLDSTQKKKNGQFNAGTNGINVKNTEADFLKSYGAAPTYYTDYLQGPAKTGNTTSGTSNPTGSKVTTPETVTSTPTPTDTPSTTGNQGFTFSGDYMADAQKLLTQLQQITSTPFNYNKDTDPSYAAAKQSLEKSAGLAKDQTYADMADRGILNSSVTTGQLGSIEQQSVQSLAQVVPGLEANAYNRYQAGVNSQANTISTLLGQLNYQQGFEADQRWKEADVTNTYESPEMLKLMKDIVGYKQGWADTKDPATRLKLQKDADKARAALAQITGRTPAEIDKLFGAKASIDQAKVNFGQGGMETAKAKAERITQENYKSETTYNQGQDTKAWDWKEKEFDQRERLSKASSSGGSGGAGLTFDQLLKNTTNRMLSTMLSEINSVDKIDGWIKDNYKDIFAAGIDPNTLKESAKKWFLGGDKPAESKLTPAELNEKVLAAAYKDAAWERADTWEKQQTIINKWREYYSPTSGTELFEAGVDLLKKWFPGLMPK